MLFRSAEGVDQELEGIEFYHGGLSAGGVAPSLLGLRAAKDALDELAAGEQQVNTDNG